MVNKKCKHGMRYTRFYEIWSGVKKRCLNKNSSRYKYYGLRGISISEDWILFNGFKQDMYDSYLLHVEEYGELNTSIDRIDTNGNYEKNNCKWSTKKEQANNRRAKSNQRWFTAISPNGEKFSSNNMSSFCREHNLKSVQNIRNVLNNKTLKSRSGWHFEYANNKQNI